jgi:hypothetical protein
MVVKFKSGMAAFIRQLGKYRKPSYLAATTETSYTRVEILIWA